MTLDKYFEDSEIENFKEKITAVNRKLEQDVKETRKVSLKAYDKKRSDLTTRQRHVLRGVYEYKKDVGHFPTANELKEYLVNTRDDWNQYINCKSRVTELKNEGQLVEHKKRECKMTENTAWSIKPSKQLRSGDLNEKK